jgi:translation elongation factor EF-4
MSRLITGTSEIHFIDHIKQDIIDHRNDKEYDVTYLSPLPESRHNFHVQIHDFANLDCDNPSQWSSALLTAYGHTKEPSPYGKPFIVTRVCKPSCNREHLTRNRQPTPSS